MQGTPGLPVPPPPGSVSGNTPPVVGGNISQGKSELLDILIAPSNFPSITIVAGGGGVVSRSASAPQVEHKTAAVDDDGNPRAAATLAVAYDALQVPAGWSYQSYCDCCYCHLPYRIVTSCGGWVCRRNF